MMSQKSHQFASLPLVGLESLENDSESETSSPEALRVFEPPRSLTSGEDSNDRLSDDDKNLLDRALKVIETELAAQERSAGEYRLQQLAEAARLREFNRAFVSVPKWEVVVFGVILVMVGALFASYLVLIR